MKTTSLLLIISLTYLHVVAQHEHHKSPTNEKSLPIIEGIEAQPFIAQAVRLSEALDFVGSALPRETKNRLLEIKELAHHSEGVDQIQQLLDPFCLAFVDINPESRVKVLSGPADPILMQEGWTTFLVKVHNQANITAELAMESPNALPLLHRSTSAHRMAEENYLSPGTVDNRFLEMAIYQGRPLKARMSGLAVEYFLIQFYTREQGYREVKLGFNVGQGTQDIGFRNTIDILFRIRKAVKVLFEVLDHDNNPTMASFTITDAIDRHRDVAKIDDRVARAQSTHWMEGQRERTFEIPEEKQLVGIFPLPARRLATKDEYPDFFFQPQIYRASNEYVYLPPGKYHVNYGRGPEYLEAYQQLDVPPNVDSLTVSFKLDRWIHMADFGWYSADHHIHAAGCSHYESPEEGVRPEDMWRQVLGEDLNMGNNLTWGPSWYHQKQYFTGENHEFSNDQNILRYDVEVSGFPSSHAGHIVLLNLKEDDYPGTTLIDEWPSWTLPIFQWAKDQGGITGYAHSGWGLAPIESTVEIPNYVMPKMDGIGANEYIVTVTHDVVDFYSAGDTPLPAELNMWYHTLNCGFTTKISGETDFPCISDERVGRARIYAKIKDGLDFDAYMEALLLGRSYVSTGHAHLIDFQVNDLNLGDNNSLLQLDKKGGINIKGRAAAYLTKSQNEIGKIIADANLYQSPYWHIERSRIQQSRKVAVELIVNGITVDSQIITADGNWNDLSFAYDLRQSSWVALRIFGSAHTNPIFIEIGNKPIHVLESVKWCRAAVDQCWEMKKGNIRDIELGEAQKAYDHARAIYDEIIKTTE